MPSFEEVVEEHMQKIFYLSLDLTGNHHDAEDLCQEAFLKAYKALKRFRGDARVSTWLYRITVNTHIDRTRRKSEVAMKNAESWDDEESVLSFRPPRDSNPASDPEQRAKATRIQDHIEQALKRLSPRQRSVFVLRHYQHLKLKEIAEVLEITQGTVKTTLFRAIRRLRDELDFYRPELGLEESK